MNFDVDTRSNVEEIDDMLKPWNIDYNLGVGIYGISQEIYFLID